MKYHEYSPHSILQDIVKCIWILESEYAPESVQEVVPDGCVELLFNFGSPYELISSTESFILPVASVVGFQNKTINFRVSGTVRVVAARLFAWGALSILQQDIQQFANEVRPAGDGWQELLSELESAVHSGNYDQAASLLQDFLIKIVLVRQFDPKHVQTAAKLLQYTKGQCRVEELADYCQLSVRQLERGFRQAIGISPKVLARTMRFDQAKTQLMFNFETDLTDLAQECGYFDQAHFIKDFRAFTGMTPTEFVEHLREFREHLKSKDVVFLQYQAEPADL